MDNTNTPQINTTNQINNAQELARPKKGPNPKVIATVFTLLLIVGASAWAIYLLNNQNQTYKNQISQLSSQLEQQQQELKLIQENATTKQNVLIKQQDIIGELEEQVVSYNEKINELENPPYFTNYLPVKFLAGNPQKLGQSFLQKETQNVSSVVLKGSYGTGENIQVNLYELNDPKVIDLTNIVATGTFPAKDIIKEKLFEVPLESSVELMTGKNYFFEVVSTDPNTEAGVGYAETDTVTDGRMYTYSRQVGGNGELLTDEHTWLVKNNYDVLYTLKSQ